MTVLKKRLKDLEADLSPRQAVYKLIDEQQQYNSFDEATDAFIQGGWRTLDKDAWKRVYEGIEKRMKAEKRDDMAIKMAQKKALDELQFLNRLFIRRCSAFICDKYRHCYNRLYLDTLFLKLPQRNKVEDGAMQRTFTEYKHRATRHLYHLYTELFVDEALGQKYFNGRSLMFRDDKKLLERLIASAEDFVAKSNMVLDNDGDGLEWMKTVLSGY